MEHGGAERESVEEQRESMREHIDETDINGRAKPRGLSHQRITSLLHTNHLDPGTYTEVSALLLVSIALAV